MHYGRCASGELFSCEETRNLRSRSEPKGSGSILLSPILCFIKRCYDKEEFDTDRSEGFLKNFKWDIMLHKVGCLGCVPQETCSVMIILEFLFQFYPFLIALCVD